MPIVLVYAYVACRLGWWVGPWLMGDGLSFEKRNDFIIIILLLLIITPPPVRAQTA